MYVILIMDLKTLPPYNLLYSGWVVVGGVPWWFPKEQEKNNFSCSSLRVDRCIVDLQWMSQNTDRWMSKWVNLWFSSWTGCMTSLSYFLYLVFRKEDPKLAKMSMEVVQRRQTVTLYLLRISERENTNAWK